MGHLLSSLTADDVPEDESSEHEVENEESICENKNNEYCERADTLADGLFPEGRTSDIEIDHVLSPSLPLTINNVMWIESQLDIYEGNAVVFLLYENEHTALQMLLQSRKLRYEDALPACDSSPVNSPHAFMTISQGPIVQWVRGTKCKNWQDKMTEALCIIQNYQVLSILGKRKDVLLEHYIPHNTDRAINVNPIRKCLFLMIDDMTITEWEELCTLMKEDLPSDALRILQNRPSFPELHLLLWMIHGLIKVSKPADFSGLTDKLKIVGLWKWVKLITVMVQQLNGLCTFPSLQSGVTDTCSVYKIDSKNPGFILIINQMTFEKEPNKNRYGSINDSDRLARTFGFLNYKVIHQINRTVGEIRKDIIGAINKFHEMSCFVVAILSHGQKGTVFGTDNTEIEIDEIRRLMAHRYLAGKPKILLIQACQGHARVLVNGSHAVVDEEEAPTSCQRDGSIETDGPNSSTADFCRFTSCVPGFEAYRSTKLGSFFIQELCNQIILHGREKHFKDLSTSVCRILHDTTLNLNAQHVIMVPEFTDTFTKDLYLIVPEAKRKAAEQNVQERKEEEQDYIKRKNKILGKTAPKSQSKNENLESIQQVKDRAYSSKIGVVTKKGFERKRSVNLSEATVSSNEDAILAQLKRDLLDSLQRQNNIQNQNL